MGRGKVRPVTVITLAVVGFFIWRSLGPMSQPAFVKHNEPITSPILSHEVDKSKESEGDPALAHLLEDKYPVADSDIGYIVVTGFEVQPRVKAAIDTWISGVKKHQVLIFSESQSNEGNFGIQDAIKLVPEWQDALQEGDQFSYYREVQSLPEDTPRNKDQFSRGPGWQFDGVKQIASFYAGVQQFRKRNGKDYKWYVIVDDDTYVHVPSQRKALSEFNSERALLLGNLWKESTGEEYFHGGSGIHVSAGAVKKLFDEKKPILAQMLATGPDASIGDMHIAKYLMEAGAILEKSKVHAFHEHHIESEYVHGDWYCVPAATWHHYPPQRLGQVHEMLTKLGGGKPLMMFQLIEAHPFYLDGSLWRKEGHSFAACDLWGHYKQECRVVKNTTPQGENVTEETCKKMCEEGKGTEACAAWFFENAECTLAKGFRLGDGGNGDKNKITGVNKALLDEWRSTCPDYLPLSSAQAVVA